MLHRKSFTKTCHEHHVYVLMHVIRCVDQISVTRNDQLEYEMKVNSIVMLYQLEYDITS